MALLMSAFVEEVDAAAESKNVPLPPKPTAAPASLRALYTAPLPGGATHGRAEGLSLIHI